MIFDSGQFADWNGDDSVVFFNPRSPQWQKDLVYRFDQVLSDPHAQLRQGLLWFQTSGSTRGQKSEIKFVGLSREAVLASAKEVTQWSDAKPGDVWMQSLPVFHIGGFSIQARAHLLGGTTVQLPSGPWNPSQFIQVLNASRPQFLSLVPTQIFDLVGLKQKAPDFVKGVFVGGGALSNSILKQAVDWGWPIYLTYGMTETGSQVATSEKVRWPYQWPVPLPVLPHLKIKQASNGCAQISGPSVCQQIVTLSEGRMQVLDINTNEGVLTQDQLSFADQSGRVIQSIKRQGSSQKVVGELVDIELLESHWQQCLLQVGASGKGLAVLVPDERRGNTIWLACPLKELGFTDGALELFTKIVRPFEKPRAVIFYEQLPQTSIGKWDRQKIILDISSSSQNS